MTKYYLDPDTKQSIDSQNPKQWLAPDLQRGVLARSASSWISPDIAQEINTEEAEAMVGILKTPCRGMTVYSPFGWVNGHDGSNHYILVGGSPWQTTWASVMTTGNRNAMKAIGIDTIAMGLNIGVFMDSSALPTRIAEVVAAVTGEIAAGMKVILRSYPGGSGTNPLYNINTIWDGTAGTNFTLWKTVVSALATAMGGFDPTKVALNLVHEPPGPSFFSGKTAYAVQMAALHQAARAANKYLTIIIPGMLGSGFSGTTDMMNLVPSMFDLNTGYAVDMYYGMFATQGSQGIAGLSYPPSATTGTPTGDAGSIATYRALPDNFVATEIGTIPAWVTAHGLSPSQIFNLEFTAQRTFGGDTAGDVVSVGKYISDVLSACHTRGYNSIGYSWDGNDGYQIQNGSGVIVPAIAAAYTNNPA